MDFDMDAVEILEDFLNRVDMLGIVDHDIAARIPKRYIRDMSNPFEYYYADVFQHRFRFSKDVTMYVLLPLVEEDLSKVNNRGLPISPVLQLLVALRFYASASYQAVLGDLVQISQPTVCLIVQRVSTLLAKKLHQYVRFPETIEEQQRNLELFWEIAHFPNIAACIDGTLIKISCPKALGEIFRCRKGFYALNVMVAAGPRGEILFIDVRHPGSTHDNTCFDRSALRVMFSEHRIRGVLLGDNGYACKPYLLVPVLTPRNEAERRYNRSHKKTRILIEKTFGRWKNKFTCLKRGLLNKVDNSITIICAAAVLWNIHIDTTYPVRNAVNYHNVYQHPPQNVNGINYRSQFIRRHFM